MEESGEWVRRTTYMRVVTERNRLQQQLSATLSEFENMHAKQVVSGAEALQESLRLTKLSANTALQHTQDRQDRAERAAATERRFADSQRVQHLKDLEFQSYQKQSVAQERVLEQSKRERARLLHQCQQNNTEIQLLKEALNFAESKNDALLMSSDAMDDHWKDFWHTMDNKFKSKSGATFNRADRFMMETKIQLLERELVLVKQAKMQTKRDPRSDRRDEKGF